jgi:hypothetical protein
MLYGWRSLKAMASQTNGITNQLHHKLTDGAASSKQGLNLVSKSVQRKCY